MKKCVLQNALQSRLSACPQQELSKAVPQATAFAFSALFYPQLLEGHGHRCRLGRATEPSRDTFIAVTSVFPSLFLFVVVLHCLLSPRWILRLLAYSTFAELICFLEVIWLNFIKLSHHQIIMSITIIILLAEYYSQIILIVIDISWSGINSIYTMILHAIYFKFLNIWSRHHLL